MPRGRDPLPSALGAVFTAHRAEELGVTRGRLRAASGVRVLARGLYARSESGVSAGQIVAALCRDDEEVSACGPTAAELLGMPLPRRCTAEMSLVVHMSARSKRVDSRCVHWRRRRMTGQSDLRDLGGMRLTSRIRTWCDLSADLGVDELTAIADHLLRRPRPRFEGRSRPYATLEQLGAEVERRRRWPGTPALREALRQARVGSDSPAETAVRLALERAGLPTPDLNTRVDERGEDLGVPDLSWPAWRVCLEHDGRHRLTRAQQDSDIARTERRVLRGWIEVRTAAADLWDDGHRAVGRVEKALALHGWTA